MSRLHLDLPDTLRHELERQAELEGISLQNFIVYSLTRLVTASDLEAQRRVFGELTTHYPQDQAEAALRSLLAMRQPVT